MQQSHKCDRRPTLLNFDKLPKTKPDGGGTLVPNGDYIFLIKKAEMRKPIKGGDDYMSVQLQCTSMDNKHTTIVFDNFFVSDKPLPQYKLAQFIRALQMDIRGEFTLKDLCKVIPDKKGIVALKTEENEGYAPRNTVNAFDDDIYKPLSPAESYPTDNSDVPFDTTPSEGNGYY